MTMAYFAPDDDADRRALPRGQPRRARPPDAPRPLRRHPLVRRAVAFTRRLLDCGVEIYERQGVILHAKTMVIDGRTTVIGSTNLDYRSIEYNCELSAVIRNETFGGQMHDLFENDVRYAKRIDSGRMGHRQGVGPVRAMGGEPGEVFAVEVLRCHWSLVTRGGHPIDEAPRMTSDQ